MEKQQVKKDRGMMKWQGLILSEHQQALEALETQYERTYYPPIQQEKDEITATLSRAFKDHLNIWLATNTCSMEGVYEEYQGYIDGFEGSFLYLSGESILIEEIRAVEYTETKKFWQ